MVLLEFAMYPTDVGESKSKYVSIVISEIINSGVTYQMTPMGTILEGSWDEVMKVVDKCFKALEPHSSRISTVIKVDYRKGDNPRMKQKIESVEKKLNTEVVK